MIEVPFQGPHFTWTNKQLGSSLLLERLDRAYVSSTWVTLFPNHMLHHEPIICSVYAAIIYTTYDNNTISRDLITWDHGVYI